MTTTAPPDVEVLDAILNCFDNHETFHAGTPKEYYRAFCPAHDDVNKPSLLIYPNRDGSVRFDCRAGCKSSDVVAKLDLLPSKISEHAYRDVDGKLLYVVERWFPKAFKARNAAGDYETAGVERVPYYLPEVRAAIERGDVVYVFEGEKDVESVRSIGLCATTSPFGATKPWSTQFASYFQGASHIVIVEDNDETGRKATAIRKKALAAVCDDIRVVKFPDGIKDATDFLGQHDDAAFLQLLNEAKIVVSKPRLKVRALEDVELRELRWLWKGYIPLGAVTVIFGQGGIGKSFVATALSAKVTQGWKMPFDGAEQTPGDVLLLDFENALHETTRARAQWCKADLKRLKVIECAIDAEGKEVQFSAEHIALIDEELARNPECRVVVIDPIMGLLAGKADTYKDAEVRAILQPLINVAEKRNIAIVVVAHPTKSANGGSALGRLAGSMAFGNTARSVLFVGSKDGRSSISQVKTNLGVDVPPVEFKILPRGGDTAEIEWVGNAPDLNAEVMLAEPERERAKTNTERAADWLEAALKQTSPQNAVPLRERGMRETRLSERMFRKAVTDNPDIFVSYTESVGSPWLLKLRPTDEF